MDVLLCLVCSSWPFRCASLCNIREESYFLTSCWYMLATILLRSQHWLVYGVLGLLVVNLIVAIPAKHQSPLIFSYLLSAMFIHSFKTFSINPKDCVSK